MKVVLLALALSSVSSAAIAQRYQRTDAGIIVTPAARAGTVRLQVYGNGIIRVTETPDAYLAVPPSLMVRAQPTSAFSVSEAPGSVTLKTNKASAEVDLQSGRVSFRDASGRVVLAESGAPAFAPASADGIPFLSIGQQVNRGTDEGFYGLGQQQNGQM